MLILARKQGESFMIGDDIEIVVIDNNRCHRGEVRIGIEAPRNVPVHREEVARRMKDVHAASGAWERMIEVSVRWHRAQVANKRCRGCGLLIMGSAVVRRRDNFEYNGQRQKHFYHPACGAIAKALRDVR